LTEGRRGIDEWLSDIVAMADKIVTYTADVDFERFARDEPIQDLVVKKIENIGEAATQLRKRHPDFVEANPQIPWRAMSTMRNRTAHGYFAVDLPILWATARNDMPDLRGQVATLLAARRRVRT